MSIHILENPGIALLEHAPLEFVHVQKMRDIHKVEHGLIFRGLVNRQRAYNERDCMRYIDGHFLNQKRIYLYKSIKERCNSAMFSG